MSSTSIEWTATYHPDGTVTPGHTVNPIRARVRGSTSTKGGYASGVGHYCEKVSPGCAHCYSSGMQPRFGLPEFPGAQKGETPVEVWFDETRLQEVLRRRVPTKWFWCDMTDMFGRWVPDEWIDRMFATMALTPHHTHQLLTKRPERMAKYLNGFGRTRAIDVAKCEIMGNMPDFGRSVDAYVGEEGSGYFEHGYLANVHLGTSVENRKALERIMPLASCPAAVHFVSFEPLLEDLGNVRGYLEQHIEWGIVGCESFGSRVGRFYQGYADAARSLLTQMSEKGVAAFHKQMPVMGRVSGDPAEWPASLRVRSFPAVEAPR